MEGEENMSSRESTQRWVMLLVGRKSHIRELLKWSSEGFLQPGLGNQARHPRGRKLGCGERLDGGSWAWEAPAGGSHRSDQGRSDPPFSLEHLMGPLTSCGTVTPQRV